MKKNEMGRACGMYGEKKIAFSVLEGGGGEKPEGKRLLETTEPKWENNVKIDLKETGFQFCVMQHVTCSTRKHSSVKTSFNMSKNSSQILKDLH
jgi:hypothetical protein